MSSAWLLWFGFALKPSPFVDGFRPSALGFRFLKAMKCWVRGLLAGGAKISCDSS